MTYRLAQTSDASSLAAISIEVWIGTYIKTGVSAFYADYALDTFTKAHFETQIADPSTHILLSENTDGIDGFISLAFGATPALPACSDTEIATFYVQPRHHGKGVGQKLLTAALEYCHARHVTSVWLSTNAENTPAIGFYLARGFKQIGETHFRIDDQAYLNTVYSLDLS